MIIINAAFMEMALAEAQKALIEGEIPVGAVIVKNGRIIARAHNMRESKKSALSHAEVEAIKKANEVLGDWRLDGCELYVTLEPCMMCMGAIKNARISELVFGAFDRDSGFCDSQINVKAFGGFCPQIYAGIKEEKCERLIKNFFEEVRKDRD